MEKEKTQPAIVATLVPTTPAMLREIANRLELSIQRVTSNETILVKVTENIMFTYQPAADKRADQKSSEPKMIIPQGSI